MYNGIVLEGISGTGKTSVFDGLTKHYRWLGLPVKSRLTLSEHHTQRVLELQEKAGTLMPQHHIQLLDELTTFIESLQQRTRNRGWGTPSAEEHDLVYLLERFHLTHVFRFHYMHWDQVKHIDDRLCRLGATLCLLTVNAQTLEERLFSRQNQCWLNYLAQYGNGPAEIVDTLRKRQELAVELASRSSLPKIIIDTSHTSIDQVVDTLIDHATQNVPPHRALE